MLTFILQVIGWIIFIYGFLSLSQDILSELTYNKINHNMKIIVLAKNLENDLENFTRELANLKRRNGYKNIVLIDLEEKDNIKNIIKKFENEEVNLKVLNKPDGEEYVAKCFD